MMVLVGGVNSGAQLCASVGLCTYGLLLASPCTVLCAFCLPSEQSLWWFECARPMESDSIRRCGLVGMGVALLEEGSL